MYRRIGIFSVYVKLNVWMRATEHGRTFVYSSNYYHHNIVVVVVGSNWCVCDVKKFTFEIFVSPLPRRWTAADLFTGSSASVCPNSTDSHNNIEAFSRRCHFHKARLTITLLMDGIFRLFSMKLALFLQILHVGINVYRCVHTQTRKYHEQCTLQYTLLVRTRLSHPVMYS